MAQLNNSAAYGFCRNIVSKVLINSAISEGLKAEKVVHSSEKTYKPIEVKIGRDKVACLQGPNTDGCISLSMHHMMNSKNVGFIYGSKAYIVSQQALQTNWSNIMTGKPYMYTDGTGIRTSMTPADVKKLVKLAHRTLSLSEEMKQWYEDKKLEYFG